MGNSEQQNIAVNIWFEHQPDHIPQKCHHEEGEGSQEKLSIDHFHFKGLGRMKNESEEIGMWENVQYPLL